MIPQETIDKIYSMTRIEEVVSDFGVSLKRAGANFKGCCPFHDEKTPSFVVSPAKGIYKCFGCGKAGNAIKFIEEYEKCSYVEAIKWLGNKYHVEIIETELSKEEKERRDIRESLQVVNSYAAKWFEDSMWETEEGRSVGLAYFMERGFTEEIIRKFRLGYSPQKKDALTNDAEKKGYKLEYLQKVGLTSVGENYKIDRFHGRVMFPIMSVAGTVIGFGGRVMTPANEHVASGAKYVNSPESEVYNKSRTLYGISFAKNEIVKKNECILVEGYTDVISLFQSGIENVVASSGTSLTKEQIDLIKRFTQNVLIIYDGDKAGIKASLRGIDMILEKDLNVRILLLPDGNDPDSFAKTRSADEITEYIEKNKTDFLTFRTKIAAGSTGNDPIARAEFINEIAQTIAKIPNAIKQAVYIQNCSNILNIDIDAFSNQIAKLKGQTITAKETYQAKKNTPSQNEKISRINKIAESEKDIIKILIKFGKTEISFDNADIDITNHINPINDVSIEQNNHFQGMVNEYIYKILQQNNLSLTEEREKKIFDAYYEHVDTENDMILDYLRDHVDAEALANILSENDLFDEKFWDDSSIESEKEKLQFQLKETMLEYIKRRLEVEREQLQKEISKGNTSREQLENVMSLSNRIQQISIRINHTSR